MLRCCGKRINKEKEDEDKGADKEDKKGYMVRKICRGSKKLKAKKTRHSPSSLVPFLSFFFLQSAGSGASIELNKSQAF